MKLDISFGGKKSKRDYRTITTDTLRDKAVPLATECKIPLNFPCTNDLCHQKRNGICTMCGVRMATEEQFRDGVRLSEFWGYLMGKVFVDKALYEGSSIFTMLKTAYNWGIPSVALEQAFPLYKDGTYEEFIAHFKRNYGGKIPQAILDDAAKHKIPGYAKMTDITPENIAREIQAGKLVIARFAVGNNTYKAVDGRISWLARDLLPLRPPNPIEGGHIWCINEHRGLNMDQKIFGPQSWGPDWCADQPEGYQGYWNCVFKTQKPYFTEGWTINDIPALIKEELKDLPAPILEVLKKNDSEEWKKLFLYFLRKLKVIK